MASAPSLRMLLSCGVLLCLMTTPAQSLVSSSSPALRPSPRALPRRAATPATATDVGTVTAERFVVQNQFKVKKGREAAFEKRWADRESRLATLDGFRYFCIMRRVDDADAPDDNNYLSCTVWQNYGNFEAWRKGDAFKEAHGGGTVGGVASMLLATAMNTKGKPVPAYWGGLLPVSTPGAPPPDGEGWRRVVADGEAMLDGECFLAMNRFSVAAGKEAAFEQRFATRDSTLTDFDGFKGFFLLRRDGGKKPRDGAAPEDGYTHSTWSVWKDKASFENWRASEKKPPPPAAARPPSLFTKPPVASFYEGILSLESAEGV